MRTLLLYLMVAAAPAAAQTTVYLRSGAPAGYIITGASNTTPVVVQTFQPHGLQAGDIVVNWGVGALVNGSCTTSTANGLRTVKDVVDDTHFSITDFNNADIAPNGAWCDGHTASYPASAAAGGKLTAYTLASQPRGWLDGLNGDVTRKLALGTNNGLTSLTVSGGVATAAATYNHGISVGDKLGVWGSATAALNNSGNPYTVTSVTSTTFSFATPAVADGTYTNRDNTCGPSGDQDCLRISQLAWSGNIWWDALRNRANWTGTSYKHAFDGGALGLAGGTDLTQYWALGAIWSLVDPTNTTMRDVAQYCVNHVERVNGVAWTINENFPQSGNNDMNDFASYTPYGASLCYAVARDYLTPDQKKAFADKMYNDIDDPNGAPCNRSRAQPLNEALATGTAQAAAATSITLDPSDTAVDGYYVNNVIQVGFSYGTITSYSSATKTATVAAWSGAAPAAGATYTIYATFIVSTGKSGATATVTGYNTHFLSDIQVGDAIIGGNTWTRVGTNQIESYVSSVDSDTSLTVLNSSSIQASTTTPTIVWIAKQWQSGDCSIRFAQNHWSGAHVLPTMYPQGGGSESAIHGGGWTPAQTPSLGGNNGYTYSAAWMALDFALADDDPRAVSHLAMIQETWWDWQIRLLWNYVTGFSYSGSYYSYVRDQQDGFNSTVTVRRSVPSFPMPDTSTYELNDAIAKMYLPYPDLRTHAGAHVPWPARWGAQTAVNALDPGSRMLTAWMLSPTLQAQPSSQQASYYLNWLKNTGLYSTWGQIIGNVVYIGILGMDPRIRPSDYTTQPLQRLFQATSRNACSATGWTCPATLRGDGVVSRTSWTDPTATHVLFQARTFWGDHDLPEAGSLRVYKVGHLLNSDTAPPGAGQESQLGSDILDAMPLFGGVSSVRKAQGGDGVPAYASITRWASALHGSWDSAYGDAGSRYTYALADLGGVYKTPRDRVQRHFVHFKKPGTEEVILQFDDIDLTSAPTPVEIHIHYTQNGEAASDCAQAGLCYNEGDTTCPGDGGCAALDSTRLIQSMEDGGTTGSDPNRNYGLISRFLSPGTITVRDDGSSYTGSNHHTHRVSICGGASCGAAVTQFESLVAHKVASGLNDVNFTAKMLNTGPKWAGVETIDASNQGGKVALFARNGLTPFQADIQTDHPGMGQYLIAGLQPGFEYRVYRNDDGTDITRQVVTDGDNTLYFEAPAGSYSIFPVGLSNLIIRRPLPRAEVGSSFQYDFASAASGSFQWAVTSGKLPAGLSLSPTGVLSGTPEQTGDATLGIAATAVSDGAVSASASITLHITPPGVRLGWSGSTGNQAILRYRRRGLDPGQRCTITVSTQPDFSSPAERYTDAGGAAARWYVAGSVTPLEPSTTYYAQADCGELWSDGDVTFTTASGTSPAPATIPVAMPALGPAVASAQVDYGASPALGSSATASCARGCHIAIPTTTNAVLYMRRKYLDDRGQVLATSAVQPVTP